MGVHINHRHWSLYHLLSILALYLKILFRRFGGAVTLCVPPFASMCVHARPSARRKAFIRMNGIGGKESQSQTSFGRLSMRGDLACIFHDCSGIISIISHDMSPLDHLLLQVYRLNTFFRILQAYQFLTLQLLPC